MKNKRMWVGVAVGVLALAVLAWAGLRMRARQQVETVKALGQAAMQAQGDQRSQAWEQFRTASEQLSESQQRALRRICGVISWLVRCRKSMSITPWKRPRREMPFSTIASARWKSGDVSGSNGDRNETRRAGKTAATRGRMADRRAAEAIAAGVVGVGDVAVIVTNALHAFTTIPHRTSEPSIPLTVRPSNVVATNWACQRWNEAAGRPANGLA